MTASIRPQVGLGLGLALALLTACHASTSDGSGSPTAKSGKGADAPSEADAPADSAAPADSSETPETPETPPTPKPPGPPERGADELHQLEGLAESVLIGEFGEPTRESEFTMSECCDEFDIELRNTYPQHAGHDDVVIRRRDWDYDGYTLTVWLHEVDGAWKVLETIRYRDDVEF